MQYCEHVASPCAEAAMAARSCIYIVRCLPRLRKLSDFVSLAEHMPRPRRSSEQDAGSRTDRLTAPARRTSPTAPLTSRESHPKHIMKAGTVSGHEFTGETVSHQVAPHRATSIDHHELKERPTPQNPTSKIMPQPQNHRHLSIRIGINHIRNLREVLGRPGPRINP